MRILAVDDDPVILDLLAGSLKAADGYTLECHATAESGLEALQATSQPFDCILLDIMLPGICGIEMCRTIRGTALHGTTPILMITASRQEDLMRKAFNAGATDFITKPLNGIELGARVNSAAMLNLSLAKAREAQHSLDELTQLTKVRFGDSIALDVPGVCDVLELENQLLRFPGGCFSMSFFSLDIIGLRGIYRSVSPPVFRKCLQLIGKAAVESLQGRTAELAYVGNGRFIGLAMGRQRIDKTTLLHKFNASLLKVWHDEGGDLPAPPEGKIGFLAGQRIWSGLSASNRVRDFVENLDAVDKLPVREEDDLFARLDTALARKH